MTDERWEEIKSKILDSFQIFEQRTEDILDSSGKVEIIEFLSPMGKMKFERTDQPLVLGKKVIGSKRIGSEQKVEYLYSDTERVHKFTAYRWDENSQSWIKMEMEHESFFV